MQQTRDFPDPSPTRVPLPGYLDVGVMIGPDYESTGHLRILRDANVQVIIDARLDYEKIPELTPSDHGFLYKELRFDDDGMVWNRPIRENIIRQFRSYLDSLDDRPLVEFGHAAENNIYVHCHMGVNRGPSLALYLMDAALGRLSDPTQSEADQVVLNMVTMIQKRYVAAGEYYQPTHELIKNSEHLQALNWLIDKRSKELISTVRKMRKQGY